MDPTKDVERSHEGEEVFGSDPTKTFRSRWIVLVPALVDRRHELVHPLAISRRERNERHKSLVQYLQGARIQLWRSVQKRSAVSLGYGKRSVVQTHVDDNVDVAIALLLDDRVCRTDEICFRFREHIDLLERQVRLKERSLWRTQKSTGLMREGGGPTRARRRT